VAVLAVSLGTAGLATAAERAGAPAAREAFGEAERLYQLGRFEEAITAYERAYDLDQQPAFLFNIALAHRRQFEIDGKVEHLRRARELYRNYLRVEPTSSRRAAVERLIEDLAARLERETPPAPPVPAPAPPRLAPPPDRSGASFAPALLASPRPTAEPARHSSALWWIAGGVLVAAAAVLTVVLTRDRRSPTDGPAVDLGGMPR
jgi:tetratricopeptide (TPR) repeat protein